MPSAEIIEQLKAEAAQHEQRAQALRQAVAVLEGSAVLLDGTGSRALQDFKGLGIVDAATRFIQEMGTPQSNREIADALQARGVQTRSKNFTATVYATLANSRQFKRTTDNRWAVHVAAPSEAL